MTTMDPEMRLALWTPLLVVLGPIFIAVIFFFIIKLLAVSIGKNKMNKEGVTTDEKREKWLDPDEEKIMGTRTKAGGFLSTGNQLNPGTTVILTNKRLYGFGFISNKSIYLQDIIDISMVDLFKLTWRVKIKYINQGQEKIIYIGSYYSRKVAQQLYDRLVEEYNKAR